MSARSITPEKVTPAESLATVAMRAVDAAAQAHALAKANALRIDASEARTAEAFGGIASELATIREILGDLVRMLTVMNGPT